MSADSLENVLRRTRVLYDDRTADYASRTREYDQFPGLHDEIDRFLTLTLGAGPLVDLGCGAGRDSRYLIGRGRSVFALDLSLNMLRATREHCGHHRGLNLVQANIVGTPFGDATFAGAWVCASLLHLPARYLRPALAEIHRILAPGAGVAISMKAGAGEGWHAGRTLDEVRWFTFVEPEEFASAMRAQGFTAVTLTWSGRDEWFVAEGRRSA